MTSGNVRLKLSALHEFAVLLFSKEEVCGCWFRKIKGRFQLKKFANGPLDQSNPAEGLKKIRKELGFGRECIIFLSGSIGKDAVFYRTAAPDLPLKPMLEALHFDLPHQVLRNAEEDLIQFIPAASSEAGSEIQVNVYAFPVAELNSLTAVLSQSLKKVDYFLYPMLPLRMSDGPLYLPEIEPDFYFADGQWHDHAQWKDEWYEGWEQNFRAHFDLPDTPDFPIRKYLGCLLVARFASSADFPERSTGINLLPRQYRPGRLRNQLRLMFLLLFLLAGEALWQYGGEFYRESRELSNLESQKKQLNQKLQKLKRSLKIAEKSQKELKRVLNQNPGENKIVEKMAAFSKLLPANVMVQSIHWTDASIDLILRSEAENLNIPGIFSPIRYWKISQMQERRRNNETTSTITLKLVPVTEEKP